MPFHIQNFLSQINKAGTAKSQNFDVLVQRQFGSSADTQRDLSFRCVNVTTPGRRIDTTETTDFSLNHSVGYRTAFQDVYMRVLLSEDLREKIFFEEWLDKITGDYRNDRIHAGMFDVGFYDDYAKNSSVEIRQYAANGRRVHIHTLREAFPIGVGELIGDWSTDELLYLDVSWRYRFYSNKIIT